MMNTPFQYGEVDEVLGTVVYGVHQAEAVPTAKLRELVSGVKRHLEDGEIDNRRLCVTRLIVDESFYSGSGDIRSE